MEVGATLISFVVVLLGILAIFSDHLKYLVQLWSEKFLPESHYALIILSIILGIIFLVVIGQNYRIKIEKVKHE